MPHLSAKTIDKTSVIEYRHKTRDQDSLRDNSPAVAEESETARAGAVGSEVHRFSAVAYLSEISCGSSSAPGTCAMGQMPTVVSGSASGHTQASCSANPEISPSTARRYAWLSSRASSSAATRSTQRSEVHLLPM